jgi:hypothetical protein
MRSSLEPLFLASPIGTSSYQSVNSLPAHQTGKAKSLALQDYDLYQSAKRPKDQVTP